MQKLFKFNFNSPRLKNTLRYLRCKVLETQFLLGQFNLPLDKLKVNDLNSKMNEVFFLENFVKFSC